MGKTDRDTRHWGIKQKNKDAPYTVEAVRNTITLVVPVTKYPEVQGIIGRVRDLPDTTVDVTHLPAGSVLYTPTHRVPGVRPTHSVLHSVAGSKMVPRHPRYTRYEGLYQYGEMCVNGVVFPVDNSRNRLLAQEAFGGFTVTAEPLRRITISGVVWCRRYESFFEWLQHATPEEKRLLLRDPWDAGSVSVKRFSGADRAVLVREANTDGAVDANY